jgi:hypothetical protein
MFGNNGTVTTDFGVHYNEAFDVAIQGDNKIVAVGNATIKTKKRRITHLQ